MGDPAALAQSLRALGDRAASVSLIEALQRVIDACVEIFAVRGSGLMLADERGDLHYVVSSDGPGRLLETLEAEVNEGPCVFTYIDNAVVTTEDVTADPRWPALADGMRGEQVRAVLGVPIRLAGTSVGSLDAYRDAPYRWRDDEIAALQRYAEVIEGLLATAVRAEQSTEVVGQLQYALDYRVSIERGIGFLMARDGVSSVQAFGRLRTAARSHRRKVVDVAEDLLRTGSLPGEGAPSSEGPSS